MGEVISGIRYGTGTPPPRVEPSDSSVPFLRATDIKDGQVLIDRLPHVSRDQPHSMDKCRLEGGELVIVRSGVNTGDCAVVPTALHGAFAAYDLIVNVDPKKAIAEFLSAFLYTGFGSAQIDSVKNRAAQPHINAEEVKALEIPLPPLDVQRRMVAELDAARAVRDRALAEAESLPARLDNEISALLGMTLPSKNERKAYAIRLSASRGSRLDATYHHPRYIDALRALQSGNGLHLMLGDILLDIAGGATPKAKDQSLYADSGIKFLRILNVKPNRLDFSDLNHIQPEVHEGLLKRSQLAADDVLMTITGRVGTAAVVTEADLPANINQHIVRLRIDTKRCLPRYLSAYLNTGLGMLLSNRPVSGGTRVALDYGAIRQTPLLLPALDVQQQVIELVEASNAEETRLRANAETVWRNARERFEQQLLQGGKA